MSTSRRTVLTVLVPFLVAAWLITYALAAGLGMDLAVMIGAGL